MSVDFSIISTIAKKMNIPHTALMTHHHRSLIVDLWLTMSFTKNERACVCVHVCARAYMKEPMGEFFFGVSIVYPFTFF